MYEPLLLTDSTYHGDTFASTIRFTQSHISPDPHSLTQQLLVKLALVNIDDLLTCLHELSYLEYTPLLLLAYLSLVRYLPTVRILGLDVSDLVPLVKIPESMIRYLHSELLLQQDHPLV